MNKTKTSSEYNFVLFIMIVALKIVKRAKNIKIRNMFTSCIVYILYRKEFVHFPFIVLDVGKKKR